jgi:hypothetical protein
MKNNALKMKESMVYYCSTGIMLRVCIACRVAALLREQEYINFSLAEKHEVNFFNRKRKKGMLKFNFSMSALKRYKYFIIKNIIYFFNSNKDPLKKNIYVK